MWRVKNNAYDILVVVSPERDGVTRVVPFIYQFEDIHTARAKDIPRYRLKVVITGVGSGRSDTFSLQAHRFMTGEQPTWSSKDLYPLVTWTEDERRGSLGVRDVMFSVEMHGDTTIAKRSAFCQQEDPSMSSQTPPTPLYVPPLSGSASPDIA